MDEDIELQRAILSSLSNQRKMTSERQYRPPVEMVSHVRQTIATPGRGRVGKRNCLQREGIMPIQQRSALERTTVPVLPQNRQQIPSKPEWLGVVNEDADPNSTNSPPRVQISDRIPGWTEMCTGGRVQRQSTTAAHILLITDEIYKDPIHKIHCSDLLLLRSQAPLPNECGMSCFSLQVQNLGSRGQNVMFGMGITPESGEEMHGFPLMVVLFDHAGGTFISVEKWRVTEQETFERLEVLERMTPLRLCRDHVTLSLVVTVDNLSLAANGEVLYPIINVPGLKLGVSLPIILGSGGKLSVRNISLASGDRPPRSYVSNRHFSNNKGGGRKAESSSKKGGNYGLLTEDGDAPRPSGKSVGPTENNGATKGEKIRGSKSRANEEKPSGAGAPLPSGINTELAERIEAEIIERSPNVQWEDIAGIPEAKRLLNEAVILPLLVPELFTGVVQPWKGVLLFGPPGTGKTMLARAVATSAKTTFFNMSASSLISKYFGESEKMVRTLFQLARHYAPSTVFFDEIDSLMSSRGGNEHEASRRVKSEMLQQIDGLASESMKRVMVLATTNRPWDLDDAMRRRLEKRIYIPLPDDEGRLDLLKRQTSMMSISSDIKLDKVVRKTEGFSGADMNLLIRDAAMMPMRRLIADKTPAEIAALKEQGKMVVSPVTMSDFEEALKKIQSSVSQTSLKEFEKWAEEFGSV